jgi:hypothetical protein
LAWKKAFRASLVEIAPVARHGALFLVLAPEGSAVFEEVGLAPPAYARFL